MDMAGAAIPGLKIEFQIIITTGNFSHRSDSSLTEGGAPQVGMQDDTGGINQRSERGLNQGLCLAADIFNDFTDGWWFFGLGNPSAVIG